MENITLGQIAVALTFIVSLIKSIKCLKKEINDSLNDSIKELLNPVSEKIEKLEKSTNENLKNLELSSIKADLVNFINDIEMELFKTHVQRLNAHELYDRYKKLGGNSYVEEHWDKLKKEGKI